MTVLPLQHAPAPTYASAGRRQTVRVWAGAKRNRPDNVGKTRTVESQNWRQH